MRFAWNAAPFLDKSDGENMKAYLLDWSRREFGKDVAAEVAAIYAEYFNIPYQRDDQRLGDNDLHTPLAEARPEGRSVDRGRQAAEPRRCAIKRRK